VQVYSRADLQRLVPRPAPTDVNSGLVCPSAQWLINKLGPPDRLKTQQRLKISTRSVGPYTVTGASIALLALEHVFDDVAKAGRTDLYDGVISDGMYNLRRIRNRPDWSTHAWGLANDNNFGPGEEMGDSMVQFGLMELYKFFHARGWFWGAGYQKREDGMHFEPSTSLIESWISMGLL
jgi:hypothetical protein